MIKLVEVLALFFWRVRIWWLIRKLKRKFAESGYQLNVIELEVLIKERSK
ncbi:MAG: hypothetical protein WC565_02075 [Parcubacteria group bacterium]|jgi:hypothetical protein